jgi:hypothetical protein
MVMAMRRCASGALVVALAAALVPAYAGSASTGAAAAPAASSADRYEGEWAHRVRPWQRVPVVAVSVERSGLGEAERDAASEPESCAKFRPSERQISRFVARARRVSQRYFMHETDWSACHAAGHLQLRGGQRAEWMVQRFGAGYLSIDGARYYLHCPDCVLGDVGTRGRAG